MQASFREPAIGAIAALFVANLGSASASHNAAMYDAILTAVNGQDSSTSAATMVAKGPAGIL